MAGKLKIRIYRRDRYVADCYTTDEAAILLSVLGEQSSAMVGRLTMFLGDETIRPGTDEVAPYYLSYDEISAELSKRINENPNR